MSDDVEEGDRYVSSDGASLCIAPYRHVFEAPAKGRWLGQPLLTAFTCEFATVASIRDDEGGADTTSDQCPNLEPAATKRPRDDAVSVSLNKWTNMLSYVEELRRGTLWLRNREAESLAAGRQLTEVIEGWRSDPLQWQSIVSQAAADISNVLSQLPPLLIVSQRDVIFHTTVRHEGWVSSAYPLKVLYADFGPAPKSVARGYYDSHPRLLFVEKPFGMPVHPSGKFRKNSVTMILEDIFGGCDRHRYTAVTNGDDDDITIVHKQYKFVMVILSRQLGRTALDRFVSLLTEDASDGERGATGGLKVFVVHRLDVATSGILMFGLDSTSARRATVLLGDKTLSANRESCKVIDLDHKMVDGNGTVDSASVIDWRDVLHGSEKHYVARVKGDFRDISQLTRVHVVPMQRRVYHRHSPSSSNQAAKERVTEDGESDDHDTWWVLSCPIYCASYFNSFYACPSQEDLPAVMQFLRESLSTFLMAGNNGGGLLLTGEKPTTLAEKKLAMRKCAQSKRPIERQCTAHVMNDTASTIVEKYPQVRSAVSGFKFRQYLPDTDESIVDCIPITGRTHQLRVHLALLTHPISNDDKYVVGVPTQTSRSGGQLAADCAQTTHESPISVAQTADSIFLHAQSYTVAFRDILDEPEWELTVESSVPLWATRHV